MIDCHVHILDPLRFPYAPTPYQPTAAETATAAQLGCVLDSHCVTHALLVGPNSGYGADNRCLLDALALGAGRYKGMVVVANDTSLEQLQALQAAGVVGVALNPSLLGVAAYDDAAPLLARLRELGMWAQVQAQGSQWAALRGLLQDSGVKLLIDHCGRPELDAGLACAGFRTVLELGRSGQAVVKLSGYSKISNQPFPYPNMRPYVEALIDAFGLQALVWASDWPFLRAPDRMDYGPLLALLAHWLPDPTARRTVLQDTPQRLFGFEPIQLAAAQPA